jgi:hypothetical protein
MFYSQMYGYAFIYKIINHILNSFYGNLNLYIFQLLIYYEFDILIFSFTIYEYV